MEDSKRDTDVKNRLLAMSEKASVGQYERITSKRVYYHM